MCDLYYWSYSGSQVGILNCIACKGSHDGSFSIHSYYELIVGSTFASSDSAFKLIWKWKRLGRVTMFLWQVMVNAFPTNFFYLLDIFLMIQTILVALCMSIRLLYMC